MSSEHHEKLKDDWESRALTFNATKRAVLFKRLPTWLNYYIHSRHMRFVGKAVGPTTRNVLDIGCGYGRISGALKQRYPGIHFKGIELSAEFAKQFEANIGPCHCGPVETYTSTAKADAILSVTVLMYIDKSELENVLAKVWSLLEDNGTLTIIEPAIDIMNLWRRFTSTDSASPTGGNVTYFDFMDLENLLNGLPNSTINKSFSLNLIPFFRSTAIHHGFIVSKSARGE